jgi:hypothetical protein
MLNLLLIMSIVLQVQLKSMQKKKVHDTNIKHKNTLTIQQTCTSPWSHIDKRGVDEEKIKKGSSDNKCHISNHQVSLQKKTCMCKRTDQISKIFF